MTQEELDDFAKTHNLTKRIPNIAIHYLYQGDYIFIHETPPYGDRNVSRIRFSHPLVAYNNTILTDCDFNTTIDLEKLTIEKLEKKLQEYIDQLNFCQSYITKQKEGKKKSLINDMFAD